MFPVKHLFENIIGHFMEYKLKKITSIKIDFIKDLVDEAEKEGFHFVSRTLYEWNSGINNFSKPGEFFYGIFFKDKCVGIGGLNIDPYTDNPNLGRVRHLYISKKHRCKGLAKLLLKEIIKTGKGKFNQIRLYTNNPVAANLYENFGFIKSSKENESHIIKCFP